MWKGSRLPSVHGVCVGGGVTPAAVDHGRLQSQSRVPLELPDVSEFTGSWEQRQAEVPKDSEMTTLRVSGPQAAYPITLGMDRTELPFCQLSASSSRAQCGTLLFL